LDNPALSRVIKRCQELPGQELFAYIDEEGQPRDIGSSDVNDYLREISGESITAKDFRTWGGSSKAIQILTETNPLDAGASERARKARELEVIKQTAAHLGNTVAVCRKYYVHPLVFEADRDGSLHRIAKAQNKKRASGLNPEERVLLKLLES
jgi:DNA topoisomerase-1